MKTRFGRFIHYSPVTLPDSRPGWTGWLPIASLILGMAWSGPAQTVVYQGLTNNALGSATLTLSGSSLVVSNLGSSGQDGCVIEDTKNISDGAAKGQASDLTVQWQPTDNSDSLPVGAYIRSDAIGTANQITNGVLGTLTETKTGTSNYVISASYLPLGAATCTVQAYYQGVLLAQAIEQSGGPCATVNILPGGKDVGDIITPLSDEWPDGEGVQLTLSGETTSVPCDVLVVRPNNVTTTVIPAAFQIVASQVPVLTITNESVILQYQGLANTTLGNATLDISSNELMVSNIGASGLDGVIIEDKKNIADGAAQNQASDMEIRIIPPDGGNTLPVGAYMQEQLIGTGGGITNGVLGTLTLTKECADCGGSNWLVSVDFSPMGASNYLVEATTGIVPPPPRNMDGGYTYTLTAYTTHLIALGQTGDFPRSFGFSYDPLTGEFSISIDFEPYGTVSADGTNVVCDHLYVTPQNVSLPFAPTGLQLVASQIPTFTITSENVTVPYAGLYFTALGSATLDLSSNQLSVGNLGSNGLDGCVIEDTKNISDGAAKGQASDAEIRINPQTGTGQQLSVGAYMTAQLIGTDGSVTNNVLGGVTVTTAGTNEYVISADFSPIGQSNFTARAYSNDMQLESFQWGAGRGMALAVTTNFPLSLGFEYENTSNVVSLSLDWGTNAVSLSAGGTVVACDHLYITPDNVSLPGAPTGLQLVGSQIPSFTITSVAVSPLLVYKWWVNKKMPIVWYGTAGLQESTDLSAWTDDTNATSPYAVIKPSEGGPAKFYRLVFRP